MEYNKIREEAKINEMILEKANDGAVKGYKAIEHAVVSGYKKIEDTFVSGWEKVEEACVDALFKKEGETTQETIDRLRTGAAAAKENHAYKEQRVQQ